MKNSINYNLKLPEIQDIVKVSDLSANFVEIDKQMKINQTNISNIKPTKIVDNLNSNATDEALSANQGNELRGKIELLDNDINLKVDKHINDSVNTTEGVHRIRIQQNKIEWQDDQGNWNRVSGGETPPFSDLTGLKLEVADKEIKINWTDPSDVIVSGNVVTKWAGTRLIRKIGSYPTNESDGTVVVNSSVRNQYKTNPYRDTGLINGTTYYYLLVPYSDDEQYTISNGNRLSGTPTAQMIYGVVIDETNLNPATAVTYTDNAIGFTPASGNNGAFNWGSWESIIKDEFKIRPCVLNNPAKTVNYYLDYDNYNLKATGGASVLTGTDGDVMIEFGADIYTKWTVVGSKHKIQFSVKPFEGATKNAFETENGYNQFAYYPLLLTQKLFQMIFKNRDSQTALGRGYVDGNSAYENTGGTNTKGFMFGETTGKQQMKFLGIEDYWGNKYQWIDGLVTDASYNLLIGNSGFNNSGSGYTSYASGVSANTAGYIDTVQGGNDKGFIIKGKSGSETTHYCDHGYLDSGRVARFGGRHLDGSNAGFARLQLAGDASFAGAIVGARLMCVNNGKLYIGAYLGTTQGGKLRSVSGATPSDNKTISVFRSEAKANN